jgi:hypothetical protein
MRNAILAVFAVAAAGAATMAGSGPAAAIDYPYCIQGGGWGSPGDCGYRSYAECSAALSGRYGTCNINPRAAFARQMPEGPYREYPRRRYYRDY